MESDSLDQLQMVIDQQEEQSSEYDEIEARDSEIETSPAEPAIDSPLRISRARGRGMRREREVRRERSSGPWRGSGSGRNRGHGSQAASADTLG